MKTETQKKEVVGWIIECLGRRYYADLKTPPSQTDRRFGWVTEVYFDGTLGKRQ